jgi:hypothetical protein
MYLVTFYNLKVSFMASKLIQITAFFGPVIIFSYCIKYNKGGRNKIFSEAVYKNCHQSDRKLEL